MAINWLTHTFDADAGSMGDDGATDWTHPEYAWDSNDSNLATVTFSKMGISEFLIPTSSVSTSAYSSYTIARVWIGVKWKCSSTDDNCILGTIISGTIGTDDIGGVTAYSVDIANTEQTDWFEVTGFIEEWTWARVEDFLNNSVALVAVNYTAEDVDFAVNQIYIKVEYTEDSVERTIHTVS